VNEARQSSVRPADRQLKGVVFDLDDTLTDHRGVEAEVWARTVEHIRAALPDVDAEELRRRHTALRDPLYAEILAGRTDLDGFRQAHLRETVAPWGELPEEVLGRCVDERNANIERARLVAGARELIDRLKSAGYRVGLLTNGPSAMQRRKVAVTGLDRVLDAIAISEEIGASKPDERAYLRAAELLGTEPAHTAMVGDRLDWDVEGPLRAGYRMAILVGGGPVALPPGAVQALNLDEVASCLYFP
jgi:putative hydrolase of the HAD superfamily